MAPPTGALIIAQTLRDLGVTVIFGLVGVPVADIAEEAINLGIRFIGFRNEQACSYAASAYGYLTGTPGVCLLVGGPGILHGIAGVSICITTAAARYKKRLTQTSDRQCLCKRMANPVPRWLVRADPQWQGRLPGNGRRGAFDVADKAGLAPILK